MVRFVFRDAGSVKSSSAGRNRWVPFSGCQREQGVLQTGHMHPPNRWQAQEKGKRVVTHGVAATDTARKLSSCRQGGNELYLVSTGSAGTSCFCTAVVQSRLAGPSLSVYQTEYRECCRPITGTGSTGRQGWLCKACWGRHGEQDPILRKQKGMSACMISGHWHVADGCCCLVCLSVCPAHAAAAGSRCHSEHEQGRQDCGPRSTSR